MNDRLYVDAAGDIWTWHDDGGQDRMTCSAHPGLNYAPYYVNRRYGPLAATDLLAAAEQRGREQERARLIGELRAKDAEIRAGLTNSKGRLDYESYDPWADLAADYLESLTEESHG